MGRGVWRRSLGLGRYEAAFRDGDIDDAVLPNLTIDDLKAVSVGEVKKEGSIRFVRLGIFRKGKLKARMGRNPATGEQIKIPARTRLRFTPAKALKDSVLGVAAGVAKAKPGAVKAVKKK